MRMNGMRMNGMRSFGGLAALTLILAFLSGACSPAEAGHAAGEGPEPPSSPDPESETGLRAEPDVEEILIPPPPGSRYQPEASALESEDTGGGPSTYGSSGHFEAERSVAHVYTTDRSLEEVARYYMGLQEETPHYMNLEDMVDWDAGPEALNIEEEPAAMLPPDEMEAAIREYVEQGYMTEEEARETVGNMEIYRKMYPKIKDVVLSTLVFDMEESPADGDYDNRQEYRWVEVEITRPFIDAANEEVRNQTAIIYQVYHMKRQGN